MNAKIKKVLNALRAVVHDPKVDREGKQLAAIVVIRVLLAAGASASTISLVETIAKAFGA